MGWNGEREQDDIGTPVILLEAGSDSSDVPEDTAIGTIVLIKES